MSENWNFYQLLVDDAPASIYLDLGLAVRAPIESQPNMAYVRIYMRSPRADGLSSNEEYETLIAVEDTVVEHVAGRTESTFAGRNTSAGTRDLYFYTSDPAEFERAARGAMARHASYEFDLGSRPDRDWSVYFDFLYPGPDDRQRMWNRDVLDSLASHGDRLDQPREIDHLVYLPDVAAAAALSDYLRELCFRVDAPRAAEDSIAVEFHRSDLPTDMDEVVVPIARRAADLGGTYDGWGCVVVTAGE